jgi:hypothetical protein
LGSPVASCPNSTPSALIGAKRANDNTDATIAKRFFIDEKYANTLTGENTPPKNAQSKYQKPRRDYSARLLNCNSLDRPSDEVIKEYHLRSIHRSFRYQFLLALVT